MEMHATQQRHDFEHKKLLCITVHKPDGIVPRMDIVMLGKKVILSFCSPSSDNGMLTRMYYETLHEFKYKTRSISKAVKATANGKANCYECLTEFGKIRYHCD